MPKKIAWIALMAALASILFSLENLIPAPLPWLRIGLANVITIMALLRWGVKEAFIILMLRVFLGSMISGKLFNPSFVLAVSGGLASLFAMAMALKLHPRFFSLIGISLLGAMAKNGVQLLVVQSIYLNHSATVHLVPFFIVSTLLSGILVGMIVLFLNEKTPPVFHERA